MNKKLLISIVGLVLVLVCVLAIVTMKPDPAPVDEVAVDSLVLQDGEYCFARTQPATTDAPYSSEEYIALTIMNNSVTGKKDGTQSGPGMMNGFTGTLKGTIEEGMLEVLYSYSIEGSNGQELELYTFKNNSLVKSRWPLVEEDSVLVPNKNETPTSLTYLPIQCK